jgi:cell division transport system ATP-binding protein
MITIKNASKAYINKVKVLNNVDLNIKAGEFISIVGQSGAGKTTLVKVLIGEERLDGGQVIVGDWDITKITGREVPFLRRQIGVIFQDFKLLPKKTLAENVAFALEVSGGSSAKIHKIVPSVMKIVGLEDKKNRYPDEVSGGEKQRAAIARALVHQPKKFGTTVILVTHNKEIVNHLKHRVITMEHGRIISDQENGKYLL